MWDLLTASMGSASDVKQGCYIHHTPDIYYAVMRGPKRWMPNKSATPWVKIPSEGCKGEITLSSAVISVYFLGAKSREKSRPSNVISVQRAAEFDSVGPSIVSILCALGVTPEGAWSKFYACTSQQMSLRPFQCLSISWEVPYYLCLGR